MSFALPWVMGGAALAALAVGLLHLLSVERPKLLLLPTARFVAAGKARSVARTTRPADLKLLALRVLALLAVALAAAGLRLGSGGPAALQIVVGDSALRSDSSQWMPELEALSKESVAKFGTADTRHMLWVPDLAADPGTGLVLAQKEAAVIAGKQRQLRELELVFLLPERVRSLRKWQAWRASWDGLIPVISPASEQVPETRSDPLVTVLGSTADDPVRFAAGVEASRLAEAEPMSAAARVFIQRDSSTLPDSLFRPGTVIVRWPERGDAAGREKQDTAVAAGAVSSFETALVAPFEREYLRDKEPAAIGAGAGHAERPIMWWADGVPAAVESERSGACVRDVHLRIPSGSDLLSSEAARGLWKTLLAPCGIGMFATSGIGDTATSAVDAALFRTAGADATWTDPWWLGPVLLVLAGVILFFEQRLRKRGAAN